MLSCALLLLLLSVTERSCPQQLSRVEERDIMQIILGRQDLSEFAEILQMDGLHRAYLDRQLTLFAPTNDAIRAFGGRIVLCKFLRFFRFLRENQFTYLHYRVTIHVVPNLPLTPEQGLRFSMRPLY